MSNSRDNRMKSSFTTSGTLHFKSAVDLPIQPGNPVERAKVPTVEESVAAMLERCELVAMNPAVQLGWKLCEN